MEHREVCSAENKALLKGNHALVDAMDMRVIIKCSIRNTHTAKARASRCSIVQMQAQSYQITPLGAIEEEL